MLAFKLFQLNLLLLNPFDQLHLLGKQRSKLDILFSQASFQFQPTFLHSVQVVLYSNYLLVLLKRLLFALVEILSKLAYLLPQRFVLVLELFILFSKFRHQFV